MFTTLFPEDDGTEGVPTPQPPSIPPQAPGVPSEPPAVPVLPLAGESDLDPLSNFLATGCIDLGDLDEDDLDDEDDSAIDFGNADLLKFDTGTQRVLLLIRCLVCGCGTHYESETDLTGRHFCLGGPKKCPLCDGCLGRLEKTTIWPVFDITGGNIPAFIDMSTKAEWGKDPSTGKDALRAEASKGSKYQQLSAIVRKIAAGSTTVIGISRITSMRYEITPRSISAELLPSAEDVARFTAFVEANRQAIAQRFIQFKPADELRQIPVVKRALSLNGVP